MWEGRGSKRKAQTGLKQRSLAFTDAMFHVLFPEVQLAAAGLTLGVIGGQIDALRHLSGCTGPEMPCEAIRAVILAQRLEVRSDRAAAHADIAPGRFAAALHLVSDHHKHGQLPPPSDEALARPAKIPAY